MEVFGLVLEGHGFACGGSKELVQQFEELLESVERFEELLESIEQFEELLESLQ